MVRDQATRIAEGLSPLDDVARMRAVRGWTRNAIHYERDPRGGDLLHDPAEVVDLVQTRGSVPGDCDDAALLQSALLESLGIPTRLTAISTRKDRRLHHVGVEARDTTGRWHWLDSFSERLEMPPATRIMRVAV